MAKKLVGVISTAGEPIQMRPEEYVASFNERTGAVVPQAGDYDYQMVGAMPATETLKNSDILDIWNNA